MYSNAVIDERIAEADVVKLGLRFASFPPGPVFVKEVRPDTWGAQQGILVGQELDTMNGLHVCDLTEDDFLEAIKLRPISLKLKPLRYLSIGPEVGKLGLSFETMSPSHGVISHVTPGTWGAENDILVGDEICVINDVVAGELPKEEFIAALQVRPLNLWLQRRQGLAPPAHAAQHAGVAAGGRGKSKKDPARLAQLRSKAAGRLISGAEDGSLEEVINSVKTERMATEATESATLGPGEEVRLEDGSRKDPKRVEGFNSKGAGRFIAGGAEGRADEAIESVKFEQVASSTRHREKNSTKRSESSKRDPDRIARLRAKAAGRLIAGVDDGSLQEAIQSVQSETQPNATMVAARNEPATKGPEKSKVPDQVEPLRSDFMGPIDSEQMARAKEEAQWRATTSSNPTEVATESTQKSKDSNAARSLTRDEEGPKSPEPLKDLGKVELSSSETEARGNFTTGEARGAKGHDLGMATKQAITDELTGHKGGTQYSNDADAKSVAYSASVPETLLHSSKDGSLADVVQALENPFEADHAILITLLGIDFDKVIMRRSLARKMIDLCKSLFVLELNCFENDVEVRLERGSVKVKGEVRTRPSNRDAVAASISKVVKAGIRSAFVKAFVADIKSIDDIPDVIVFGKTLSDVVAEKIEAINPRSIRAASQTSAAGLGQIAGPEVADLGLRFSIASKEPVKLLVGSVRNGTWASRMGFSPGDQIEAVNGKQPSQMEKDELLNMLKSRPIVIAVRRALTFVDTSDQVERTISPAPRMNWNAATHPPSNTPPKFDDDELLSTIGPPRLQAAPSGGFSSPISASRSGALQILADKRLPMVDDPRVEDSVVAIPESAGRALPELKVAVWQRIVARDRDADAPQVLAQLILEQMDGQLAATMECEKSHLLGVLSQGQMPSDVARDLVDELFDILGTTSMGKLPFNHLLQWLTWSADGPTAGLTPSTHSPIQKPVRSSSAELASPQADTKASPKTPASNSSQWFSQVPGFLPAGNPRSPRTEISWDPSRVGKTAYLSFSGRSDGGDSLQNRIVNDTGTNTGLLGVGTLDAQLVDPRGAVSLEDEFDDAIGAATRVLIGTHRHRSASPRMVRPPFRGVGIAPVRTTIRSTTPQNVKQPRQLTPPSKSPSKRFGDAACEEWRLPLTKGHHKHALYYLLEHMLKSETSLVAAWRRIMDPNGDMRVNRAQFFSACKRMSWNGDMLEMWNELSTNNTKPWILLSDLDYQSANVLVRFHKALMRQHKDMESAMRALGLVHGKRMHEEEFMEKMRDGNFVSQTEAEQLFHMLNDGAHQAATAISPSELLWLDKAVRHIELPQPSRHLPGAVAGPDPLGWKNIRSSISGLGGDFVGSLEHQDDIESRTHEGWRSDVVSESRENAHRGARYLKLYREAFQRKASFTHHSEPRSPRRGITPERLEMNLQHVYMLHDEAADLHRKREVERAEQYERMLCAATTFAESNPESIRRLLAPRNPFSKVKHLSTYPSPPVKTTDFQSQAIHTEKMWKEHEVRKSKQDFIVKDRERKEVMDLQAARNILHDPKKYNGRVFDKNHGEYAHMMKRRAERMQKAKELKEQSELEARQDPTALPTNMSTPNLGNCHYRLHYDYTVRELKRDRETYVAETQRDLELGVNSIHYKALIEGRNTHAVLQECAERLHNRFYYKEHLPHRNGGSDDGPSGTAPLERDGVGASDGENGSTSDARMSFSDRVAKASEIASRRLARARP